MARKRSRVPPGLPSDKATMTAPDQKKIRAKSQDALAERYGVSRQSINVWLRAGAPRRKDGFYNLIDWDAWVAKYKSSESKQEDTLAAVTLELKREDLLHGAVPSQAGTEAAVRGGVRLRLQSDGHPGVSLWPRLLRDRFWHQR